MTGKPFSLSCLATAALITLVTAGCSSSPSGTSSTTTAGSGARAQAVKFAECMRDNGVSGFPDPDASGELTVDGVANGSSVDPTSAAFDRALKACKDLEPSGFTGHRRSAEQQKGALTFARCVRANGVKDFPDPGPDDPLIDTTRIPSSERDGGMAILDAALRKCGDLGAAAGVTGGRS